jgi:hypothetical protein
MKKTMPAEIPAFKSDEEIAAFMEKYDGYDLVEAGLATTIPTPFFVRGSGENQNLLKDKRIQISFRDEQPFRKILSSKVSELIFRVIDADFSGILVTSMESPDSGSYYIPYLNIGVIKLLDCPK